MRLFIFLLVLLQVNQILSDDTSEKTTSTQPTKTKYPQCTIVLPNGAMQKYYQFDTDGAVDPSGVGLTIIGGSGCQLRSLMVGGGGHGGALSTVTVCGGGSGHLVYMKKPLDNPSYDVWVKPGLPRQSSLVSIDGIITTANPGTDAGGPITGGFGYSGGE